MADAPVVAEPIDGIPVFYMNGLALGVSNADVSLTAMLDNVPHARLHMSFTMAKTLQKYLSDALVRLEGVTKHEIMLTSDVEAGLRQLTDKP